MAIVVAVVEGDRKDPISIGRCSESGIRIIQLDAFNDFDFGVVGWCFVWYVEDSDCCLLAWNWDTPHLWDGFDPDRDEYQA